LNKFFRRLESPHVRAAGCARMIAAARREPVHAGDNNVDIGSDGAVAPAVTLCPS
jgi:hypothetical protein